MRGVVLISAGLALGACAPDFSTPTSPAQWERRQQAIERREAERRAFCERPGNSEDSRCQSAPGAGS